MNEKRYDPETRGRMKSKPCVCCLQDSIRAFRSGDALCKRCFDEPGSPFFIPSGRGLRLHSCSSPADPGLVEDVKVAERSGMVVVLLKNGNALSLNPQVVKRLARAGQPEPGSVWDRVRGMLGR